MKFLDKVAIIAVLAAFATGCASTSDLESLDARVASLEGKVAAVATDAAAAKAAAAQASEKAGLAIVASNRAADAIQGVNAKLDKLFQKSQYK